MSLNLALHSHRLVKIKRTNRIISFLEHRKPVALKLEPPIKMGHWLAGNRNEDVYGLSYRKPIHSGIIKNSWSISIFPRSWPLPSESMPRRTQNGNTAWETREAGAGVALINFPFAMPTKRKRHWRDYFNLHRSVRNYFIEAGWPPPTRAKIHRRRFSTKLQFTNLPLLLRWCSIEF